MISVIYIPLQAVRAGLLIVLFFDYFFQNQILDER